MDIENLKSLVKTLREYNDMGLDKCQILVDQCLDGEHEFNDAECKQFLINRVVVQIEHELSVR